MKQMGEYNWQGPGVEQHQVKTYVSNRRLEVGDTIREPGEPMPEAVLWLRIEDWTKVEYVKEVWMTPAELAEIIHKYATDETHADLMAERYDIRDHIGGTEPSNPRVKIERIKKGKKEPVAQVQPEEAPVVADPVEEPAADVPAEAPSDPATEEPAPEEAPVVEEAPEELPPAAVTPEVPPEQA